MWTAKSQSRSFAPIVAALCLALSLSALLAACPSIDVVETEIPAYDGPTLEFNPAEGIIPFPNDLLLDPMKGLVAIPEPCSENEVQKQLRVGVLNSLDGFGVYEPGLQVTLTEIIDPATLAGHVHLFELGGAEVPTSTVLGQTTRANSDCSGTEILPSLTIVPQVPLLGGSEYVVVLTEGVASPDGAPFIPSATWSLIRQSVNPVTVVDGVVVAERTPFDLVDDAPALLGVNQLWNALAPTLRFVDDALGVDRGAILIAWQFRTQTTTAPLDPRVADSLAANLPAMPLVGVTSITGANSAEEFLAGVLGVDACAAIGCASVGEVLGGVLLAPNYQVDTPNPLAGGAPIPGPWSNPITPTLVHQTTISVLALIPATPPPPGGYPIVVFGHGLTRSKNDLMAIGPQLASVGLASIAMDWGGHGSRAIQTANEEALGCANTPDPTTAAQCFAPLLSSNLAATRDNLRQAALDAIALIDALERCQGNACDGLLVDPDRIAYLGHSLGALLGSVVASASPGVRVAVLNLGGVGWVDILENTATLAIRCPLIDALIGAGVLAGEPSNLRATPPTGTCLGSSWRSDPGWLSFANIARWVLDPADGANFLSLFGERPVLVQELVDDPVVPNIASERLAALLAATDAPADPSISPATVSAAITEAPTEKKLVRYATRAADPSSGFPGNSYDPGSLLSPASDNAAGQLGTALMQRDAITYLLNNL